MNSKGKKKISSSEPSTTLKESESVSTSTSQTDIPLPSVNTGANTTEISSLGRKVKTVKEVKEAGGKPDFENYVESASASFRDYVSTHGNQITEGIKKGGKSIIKLANESVSPVQKPIAEKIKAQANNGLDMLLGGAESAFGAISFTPTGAAFNVAAETIIPEKVNEWLFSPAHKIAEQFGYEQKQHEGDLGEKSLQVLDIVGSLFAMKGAESIAKGTYDIGKGVAKEQIDIIQEKLKKKEPLTAEESKVVADVVAETKPTELKEAVAENKDKLVPLWLRKDKVVDVVEKSLEGKDVKADIAKLETNKEDFDQVVDLAIEADQIDAAKGIQLKKDFSDIESAKSKVPDEFKGDPEIISLVAEKDVLKQSKEGVDESFHPEIDKKIESINEKIESQKLKQKENVQEKTKNTPEGGLLRLEDERNNFIQEKIANYTDPLAIEKGKVIYGEIFDKQQKLKESVSEQEKGIIEDAETRAKELVGENAIQEKNSLSLKEKKDNGKSNSDKDDFSKGSQKESSFNREAETVLNNEIQRSRLQASIDWLDSIERGDIEKRQNSETKLIRESLSEERQMGGVLDDNDGRGPEIRAQSDYGKKIGEEVGEMGARSSQESQRTRQQSREPGGSKSLESLDITHEREAKRDEGQIQKLTETERRTMVDQVRKLSKMSDSRGKTQVARVLRQMLESSVREGLSKKTKEIIDIITTNLSNYGTISKRISKKIPVEEPSRYSKEMVGGISESKELAGARSGQEVSKKEGEQDLSLIHI